MKRFLITNKNALKDYDHYDYHSKNTMEFRNTIIKLLKQGITDLNCIDVSKVTTMSWLFYSVNNKITVSDIDVSKWNVFNVTNMEFMFCGCTDVEMDIFNWDVSNVMSMMGMFDSCNEFNSDLSKWNVSSVFNMCSMFSNCKKLNTNISNWDVSNCKDMTSIFDGCTTLKKNKLIPNWYKYE